MVGLYVLGLAQGAWAAWWVWRCPDPEEHAAPAGGGAVLEPVPNVPYVSMSQVVADQGVVLLMLPDYADRVDLAVTNTPDAGPQVSLTGAAARDLGQVLIEAAQRLDAREAQDDCREAA
ncbi:MAG: hypothetical protein JNL87_09305 [Burkholderiaceae bacterium]|nr:hypothetical protein [Burkholderiaceae bacterium]